MEQKKEISLLKETFCLLVCLALASVKECDITDDNRLRREKTEGKKLIGGISVSVSLSLFFADVLVFAFDVFALPPPESEKSDLSSSKQSTCLMSNR